MDSPQEPRERRYISNPNHVNSMGPSTHQPTPQQPHFDPFSRRDPFMPTSQSEKKDAPSTSPYWSPSGPLSPPARQPDFQHRDILQPAPPPPPSPFGTSAFGHDHARRSSIGGDSHIGSNGPPPPVPSFLNRNMPPPSSSPNQSPPHSLSRANLLSPTSNGGSRDGSGPLQPSRPSNNMSISSIMGSDSPSAQRGPAWSPVSKGFPAYPPPRSPNRNGAEDRRPATQQYGPYLQATPSSPDPNRNVLPGMSSSYQSPSNGSLLPPRPYSQPAGSETQHRDHRDSLAGRENHGPAEEGSMLSGRRTLSDEYRRNLMAESSPRDRALSDTRPAYGPPQPRHGIDPSTEGPSLRSGPGSPHQHWRPSLQNSEIRDPRDPDRPIASREGPQLPPNILDELRPFGPVYGPLTSQADQHLGSTMYPSSNVHPPLSAPPFGERRHYPGSSTQSSFTDSFSKPPYLDAHLRRSLEASQMSHRSIIGASQEAHRRIDRGSPLPQAVQGASSQPVGSGRDPSVKSEFGRMFSGLGSGVGSTPVPQPPRSNDSPTPGKQRATSDDVDANGSFRRQKRSHDADGRLGSESGDGRATPTLSARGGKRSKQSQPGHHHHHHHNHPSGHHHHHYRNNPEDDIGPPVLGRRTPSTPFSTLKFNSTVMAPGGVTTPGASTAIGLPRHHHHGHHHHHNPPARASVPLQPFRRPMTTIKTRPLVQSLAHLPRKHLGSQLYVPRIAMPSSISTPLYTKHAYSSVPNSLPNFEGKENCTFTMRVPRFYLTDAVREHVCHERKVWGTDVYTDDSDVLAAAIHSGWIRGAWGDDVDISMLELDHSVSASTATGIQEDTAPPESGQDAAVADPPEGAASDKPTTKAITLPTDTLTEPPETGPVAPPAARDAHITVLVLPPLEVYAPSTWHGIRSRKWGDNHDGMSFKIDRVEWVDEGAATRFQERRKPGISSSRAARLPRMPGARIVHVGA